MEEATPTHAQQVKLLAMALATAILIMQTVSAVKFSITSLHATTIIIMIGLVLPSLQRLACLDGFLSVGVIHTVCTSGGLLGSVPSAIEKMGGSGAPPIQIIFRP